MMRRAALFLLFAGCAGSPDLPPFNARTVELQYPALAGRILRASDVPPPPAPAAATETRIDDPAAVVGPCDRVEYEIADEPNPGDFPGLRRDFIGMTLGDVRRQLIRDLSKYLKRPEVTVRLVRKPEKPAGRYACDVVGTVRAPGPATSAFPVRVSQALSRAGGFADDAAVNQILVLRFAGARLDRVIVCDLLRGFERRDRSEDVTLEDGDVVFAPTPEGPPWDAIADAAAGRGDRAALIRALASR